MDVAGRKRIGLGGPAPARGIAVAVLAAVVGGCVDLNSGVDLGPDSIWEASLTARVTSPDPDVPRVTGQAAAVVQNGVTEVGVTLEGLESTLYWGLYRGSCAQPQALVGPTEAYPVVTPSDPSVQTRLAGELDRAGSYHVRAGPNADGSSPVTCGELVARDDV